jgi:hypothetical protein
MCVDYNHKKKIYFLNKENCIVVVDVFFFHFKLKFCGC